MALSEYQLNLMARASGVLNANLAGNAQIDPVTVYEGMTWSEIDSIVRDLDVELTLQRNQEHADEMLNEVAEAFADFHDQASDVEVEPPSDDQVEDFKDSLRRLHEEVQADQQFAAAATFAGALADLIEEAQA